MKIICVGRNYAAHIEEMNSEKTESPVLFMKPDTAVLHAEQGFYVPDFSENIHHEIELLVKINKIGKHIAPEFAHTYYSEISLGIDFTARDLQSHCKTKGLPWEKAKAFDNSALIGTWLPKEDFGDINAINFHLNKNGTTVQQANTLLMLWKTDELIAHISTYFTLKTGDIIFTGTPSGVGKVVPGDHLEGYIEGIKNFDVHIK